MSIDDAFLRDPRVARLARVLGWSVRETRGTLLEVFAICYDRVSPVVSEEDVDVAVGCEGFALHLIACDLAQRSARGLRIAGASKRLEYLQEQARRGRLGGRQRGANVEHPAKASGLSGSGIRLKPSSASASASSPAPSPAHAPDLGRGGASPAPAPKRAHRLPESWAPSASHRERASREGLDLERESEQFRNHHLARGTTMLDWDRAFFTWLGNAPRFSQTAVRRNGSDFMADSLREYEQLKAAEEEKF